MATCNAGSWRLFDAVQRPGVIYVDAYGTNARPRPDNKAHPALPRPDKTGLKDAVAHRWARVAGRNPDRDLPGLAAVKTLGQAWFSRCLKLRRVEAQR